MGSGRSPDRFSGELTAVTVGMRVCAGVLLLSVEITCYVSTVKQATLEYFQIATYIKNRLDTSCVVLKDCGHTKYQSPN